MWAFLASPAARYLAAAVLSLIFVGSVYGYGYLEGKKAADQSARIATLERDAKDLTTERDAARAQRDEIKRQAEAANAIAAEAAKNEQQAAVRNGELDELVRKYEAERKASAGVCLPDHDAARRLREIYDRTFDPD